MSTHDNIALGYYRVSTLDEESIDTQRTVCIEKARHDEFQIPADFRYHYSDDHVSGAERHRAGLDELIKDVQAGRVGPKGTVVQADRLYIRDQARLWRGLDPRFPQYFEYLMEEYGILVRYTNEDEVADYSEGVRGRHVGTFISRTVSQVHAAGERLELREKFRQGRRKVVLKGFYPSASVPYGIERILVDKKTREFVRVVPPGESTRMPGCRFALRPADNEEAHIVRLIYDLVRGMSLQSVADELNRRGVPSPGGGDGTWAPTMVGRILHNRIYCGTLLWCNPRHVRGKRSRHKRWKPLPPVHYSESEVTSHAPILYPLFLQPLIPINVWNEVQDILSARDTQWDRRRAAQPVYPFSGKVRCAECGALYNGQYTVAGSYTYVYYVHDVGYKSKYLGCPHVRRRVRTDALEQPVLNCVRELITSCSLDSVVREELGRMLEPGQSAQVDHRQEELRREIDKLEHKLASATEDALQATGSYRDVLVARAAQLGAQVDSGRRDLADLAAEERRITSMRERRLTLLADRPALVRQLDSNDPLLVRSAIQQAIEVVRYDSITGVAEVVLRLTGRFTKFPDNGSPATEPAELDQALVTSEGAQMT